MVASLNGKVVVITGASSGIGRGTAVCFSSSGAKLVLTGRSAQGLAETKKLCLAAGAKESDVLEVSGNLVDAAFRAELVQKTVQHFGKLDVLVNNAGMERLGTVLEQTDEQFLKDHAAVFDLNVTAIVDLTKKCVPHLVKNKGSIVNVSSICSTKAWAGYSHYCMSKAAIDMFTKCMALELGSSGVRVNSVNPGEVETAMLQRERDHFILQGQAPDEILSTMQNMSVLSKIGEPADIGRMIVYLASDEAKFITGSQFVVDGGLLLK